MVKTYVTMIYLSENTSQIVERSLVSSLGIMQAVQNVLFVIMFKWEIVRKLPADQCKIYQRYRNHA